MQDAGLQEPPLKIEQVRATNWRSEEVEGVLIVAELLPELVIFSENLLANKRVHMLDSKQTFGRQSSFSWNREMQVVALKLGHSWSDKCHATSR